MNPDKETIRVEAIRHRDHIAVSEDDLDAAARLFMDEISPEPGQVVSAYWPKGREFNTWPLIELLLERGVHVALPVVRREQGRRMGFALWERDAGLAKGAYGTMQPEITPETRWMDPDIVIVPLLAFDQSGCRLGYGGGYYDATIRELRAEKEITAVGLAYAEQACLFRLPREDHDEMLDWVITPARSYKFI